jgi:Mg2+/Co2+ transporter CorB
MESAPHCTQRLWLVRSGKSLMWWLHAEDRRECGVQVEEFAHPKSIVSNEPILEEVLDVENSGEVESRSN